MPAQLIDLLFLLQYHFAISNFFQENQLQKKEKYHQGKHRDSAKSVEGFSLSYSKLVQSFHTYNCIKQQLETSVELRLFDK